MYNIVNITLDVTYGCIISMRYPLVTLFVLDIEPE